MIVKCDTKTIAASIFMHDDMYSWKNSGISMNMSKYDAYKNEDIDSK